MDQVKVYYDRTGNSLTVWFADPQAEHVSEEVGGGVILMKDSAGQVIGFEKLNYSIPLEDELSVSFEAVSV